VDIRGVGYLGLTVPDPATWARFATDVIGLMRSPRVPGRQPLDLESDGSGVAPDGSVYLKADEHMWRLALHHGARPGLAYAGFELASERSFDEAVAHLEKESFAPQSAGPEELTARSVRAMAYLNDPSGYRIELYWGPTVDGPLVSGVGVPRFVTGSLGFGHYVLLVRDLAASMDFYQRALGMKLTDYVLIGPDTSVQFLRCTPRHHSVGLAALGTIEGLHHVAFEVTDIDQVGYALDRAEHGGHKITATLGRHRNDHMLSFYMRSPAGFEAEIGCDGRLVDDATWVVNRFTGGDEWGHHGLTGDSLAESVGSQ
jgi:3,4-dihydroxy-9,10-secoandrosta-1,3,5(10)-triene-9,17-dione 4,5-dioxygenase